MTASSTITDIYLRLSDPRNEGQLDGREDRLRAEADRLGWTVHQVIKENDLSPGAENGDGRIRGASAFTRKKIRLPNGQMALRTVRPGFRDLLLPDIMNGVNLLAEDLDRLLRQPRDGEDLLDAVEIGRGSARSLSGSLTLTNGGTDTERMIARVMAAVASKSSADTARRVTDARLRYAETSFQGGRRRFGFRHDPDALEYHKTLIIVEAEAEIIQRAAADVLDRGISMQAITRSLNEAGIPTTTGGKWVPTTLRDTLIKPANAGLTTNPAVDGFLEAPWPAILPRDRWEQLRDKLTDPARYTGGARGPRKNEPRYLVSAIARCACGETVSVSGAGNGKPGYRCLHAVRRPAGQLHLSRSAVHVDDLVARRVIWRLSQPDADSLLLPPPVPGEADPASARAELHKLRAKSTRMGALFAADTITEAQLTSGTKEIRSLTEKAEARLAAAARTDPLAEFRGRPADVVWDSLTLARKRAVVRLLADVTFVPVPRPGSRFNPAGVRLEWKA